MNQIPCKEHKECTVTGVCIDRMCECASPFVHNCQPDEHKSHLVSPISDFAAKDQVSSTGKNDSVAANFQSVLKDAQQRFKRAKCSLLNSVQKQLDNVEIEVNRLCHKFMEVAYSQE